MLMISKYPVVFPRSNDFPKNPLLLARFKNQIIDLFPKFSWFFLARITGCSQNRSNPLTISFYSVKMGRKQPWVQVCSGDCEEELVTNLLLSNPEPRRQPTNFPGSLTMAVKMIPQTTRTKMSRMIM